MAVKLGVLLPYGGDAVTSPSFLREFAAAAEEAGAGRSAEAVEVTVWPGSYDGARNDDVELGRTYVDAGATRLVLRPALSGADPLEALTRQITEYSGGIET